MGPVLKAVRKALMGCLSGVAITVWLMHKNAILLTEGRILFLLILAVAAAMIGCAVYFAHQQSIPPD